MKFKDIPLCSIESLDVINLDYVYPIYLNANLNDLVGSGIVYIEDEILMTSIIITNENKLLENFTLAPSGILKNGVFRITSLNLTLHPEDKNLKPLKFYKEQ